VAFALLARLGAGEIVIVEDGVRHRFGDPGAGGLSAVVCVHSPHAYLEALTGSVGLARSYIDGLWDCDDLVALVRVLSLNMEALDRLRDRAAPITDPLRRATRWLQRNTRQRSRERIAAHYDIGTDLFTRMLDETMTYSCAIFPRPDASLHQAQLAKMDMVCRKLRLAPDDHLLEIGTGWGGFAVFAASRYGCRVTTTTISAAQHDHATEQVDRAQLSGRVRVLLEDYRDLRGSYDKLASIEMIEAVGWGYFDAFFAACSRLLVGDGAMLLQAIVTPEGLMRQWRTGRGFTNTIIFPGGCLPSVEAILHSLRRVTDMRLTHLEDITPHYPLTLRAWRQNFHATAHELDARRYDERFRRTWNLYLSYCEGGFAERRIRNVQMLLVKAGYRAEAVGVAGVPEELVTAPTRGASG